MTPGFVKTLIFTAKLRDYHAVCMEKKTEEEEQVPREREEDPLAIPGEEIPRGEEENINECLQFLDHTAIPSQDILRQSIAYLKGDIMFPILVICARNMGPEYSTRICGQVKLTASCIKEYIKVGTVMGRAGVATVGDIVTPRKAFEDEVLLYNSFCNKKDNSE